MSKSSTGPVETSKSMYSRRKFLQSMVLGSAGILVGSHSGKASPSWANTSARLPRRANSPRATFVMGEVSGTGTSSFQLRNLNTGKVWTVDYTKNLSVWKGSNTKSASVIEVGDQVSVRGRTSGPNRVTATRIWDNMAWRKGRIVSVSDTSLVVSNSSEIATVVFDVDTEWFSAGSASDHFSGKLHAGSYVNALGLLRRSGELLATRVWVAP